MNNRKDQLKTSEQANKQTEREQDGGGVGGREVHLSPWIHWKHTFRHRSTCRTSVQSGQEYLTRGKEYIEPRKHSVGQRN